MRFPPVLLALLLSVAFLAACSSTPVDVGTEDASTDPGQVDAGPRDAGHPDARGLDAGDTQDSDAGGDAGLSGADGGLDDGDADAGATDGGAGDGGTGDGGTVALDAGATDGGPADAGGGAGELDGGSADAGAGLPDCLGPTHVLYEQLPSGPQGQFTFVNLEDAGYARWADDFTVPVADGCWCVESITADGFPSTTAPPPAGISWRLAFFESATSLGLKVPGSQMATLDLVPTTLTTEKAVFTLSATLRLTPGLRWLSVAGLTKTSTAGQQVSGPAWAWFNSAAPHVTGGNSAAIIDSGGLLPGNQGVWFSGEWLRGVNDVDLAFKLHGRTAASCQ